MHGGENTGIGDVVYIGDVVPLLVSSQRLGSNGPAHPSPWRCVSLNHREGLDK